MASTFPTSVDSLTAVVDGSTKVAQNVPNPIQEAVEAHQTFTGESGAAQSHNTDMLAQMFGVLKPTIKLSYNSATQIDASAGNALVQNAAGSVRKMRKNTSTTTITPTLGASTQYEVYAIGDAAATVVTFEVIEVGDPLSGTNYLLIGGFCTNSSSEIVESSIWSVGAGPYVNSQFKEDSDAASVSGSNIPDDNTKPQSSEGYALPDLVTVIAVPSANSIIEVEGQLSGGYSTNGPIFLALFDGVGTDAKKTAMQFGSTNEAVTIPIRHRWVPGSKQILTISLRYGPDGTSTFYLNGRNGGAKLGATLATHLSVKVIEP